jgi:hypothetical protein
MIYSIVGIYSELRAQKWQRDHIACTPKFSMVLQWLIGENLLSRQPDSQMPERLAVRELSK